MVENASSARMLELFNKVDPFPGLIISPGIDNSIQIMLDLYPGLTVHEYESGMECEDWIVPQSWEAVKGYVKDENGDIIASLEENKLFAAPFSESVDGWFSKSEIEGHLATRPDVPEAYALEHRIAYNYQLSDWRISIPYSRWQKLAEEKQYHVCIEVILREGTMKVVEFFKQGRSDKVINISAHLDELCNDDFSGCVVALELINHIKQIPDPYYSYQILLAPEMFGTLFYVKNNNDIIKRTVGMFNLEAVGAGEKWCLKKALQKNSLLEKVLRMALDGMKIDYREVDFFVGYGNDERVYAWPTINIPGVSLQRFPFYQYHTSEDTSDIIDMKILHEAISVMCTCIDILEKNKIPVYTQFLQPWLTRHNLYFDCTNDRDKFQKFNNCILFNINGENTLLDLAILAGLNFYDVYNYLLQFVEKNIIVIHDLNN